MRPCAVFVGVASAHHIDPHGRLAIHSVVDAFQPVIEPAQLKLREIERGILGKLRFAGVVQALRTMDPGADDESLKALLGFRRCWKIQIGDRRAPGIVPTGGVIFGNVLVLGQVVDYAAARVLPKASLSPWLMASTSQAS